MIKNRKDEGREKEKINISIRLPFFGVYIANLSRLNFRIRNVPIEFYLHLLKLAFGLFFLLLIILEFPAPLAPFAAQT